MKKTILVIAALAAALMLCACAGMPAPAVEQPAAQQPAAPEAVPAPEKAAAEAAPAEAVSAPASTDGAAAGAPAEDIGIEGAKRIAFEHAGLGEAQAAAVDYLRSELDMDDGRRVYEVDFYYEGVEYEYDIDPATGKILSFDNEIEGFDRDDYNAVQQAATDKPQDTAATVSEEKARDIVLARVPGASASDVRIRLDTDDGRQVYEGELIYDGWEYDFELSAATGDILEWDTERWPDND